MSYPNHKETQVHTQPVHNSALSFIQSMREECGFKKKNNKCTYLLQWQRWVNPNPNPSLDTEESDSCPGIRVLHLWILFCSCRCWFRLTGPLLKVSKIFHILPARSCTSGLHPFLCLKFLMKVGTGWAETHRDHVSLTAESFSGGARVSTLEQVKTGGDHSQQTVSQPETA